MYGKESDTIDILERGMTTKEVAEMLNVSDRSIRNYCKSQKLTHYIFGGKILILPEDVEEFIQSLKIERKKENENHEWKHKH